MKFSTRPILFALVAALPGAQAPQPKAPVIVVKGHSFYTWSAYTRSPLFRSAGLRCKTPPLDPTLRSPAAGTASDCAYGSTNPTAEYDPGFLYDIPVVVHVIEKTNGTGHITESKVKTQIDILNEDFRALAGSRGAPGMDGRIRFHLATVDPAGNATNGITYSVDNTWFNDGGSYFGALAWDTRHYLNIYTNNAGGFLGYVPDLPQGGIVGSKADRVVILWSSFGLNGPIGPPYNKGRTTTHEVGHYLGLWHPFDGSCGSASACYTTGDRICDTNGEKNPRYGCPGSASSCGTSDPFHNYMDYSDDLCMWEFTQEQVRRMRCTIEHWRPVLPEVVDCNPTYGSGCGGSGAFVPALSLSGCASPGADVSLDISNGLGGAASFLFMGTGRSALPMSGTCTLNTFPLLPVLLGPLTLQGSGPGNGTLSVTSTVPPGTATGSIMLQDFQIDPAGQAGWVNSNGVEMIIR